MATISAQLVVALLVVALVFAVDAAEPPSSGPVSSYIWRFPTKPDHSWHPINGSMLRDQKVQDIASFAVATYNGDNWLSGAPLKLLSVDEGEVLAVGGTVYHLYLTVSNGVHMAKRYHTFVLMYPGTRWESLLFVLLSE
ncbi:unnamed protein product [Linum tenue]|uniref:Cystatin domain-containing protein n=1 Tax=Linum tenue TaxID=586396 RepID=A0AAV0QR54_9ROSI|nr:unnamed protein product [Linum tenue]